MSARIALTAAILAGALAACGGSNDASSLEDPVAREDFLIGCLDREEGEPAPRFENGVLQAAERYEQSDLDFCECVFDGVSAGLTSVAENDLDTDATDDEIAREAFNRYRELDDAVGEFPEILSDDPSEAAQERVSGDSDTRVNLRKSVDIQADEVGRCRAEFLL